MRRRGMLWGGIIAVAVLLATAGVAVTAAVTRTPERHVEAYLAALAADDAVSLRLLAGLPGDAPLPLGDDGTPTTAAVRATEQREDGRVAVVVEYGEDGRDTSTAIFVLEPATLETPTGWRFTEPPLATIALTAPAGVDAIVNGRPLDGADGAEGAGRAATTVTAFVPARVTAQLDSPWLVADPSSVRAGSGAALALVGSPTSRLERAVQQQVAGFLAECTEQRVLLPRGCPFGLEIDDRVLGEPRWSVEIGPALRIAAAPDGDGYRVEGEASMRLRAEVQRLRDGVIEQLDTLVPAAIDARLTISGETPELEIRPPAA
ncbi:hypothetical protein OVN20_02450 [Microcella daejeonensis]|uniref:hypothetical protein n=1 Tax=Microcella daejeonensis TaxID=2994971 RepID=UPI00226D9182|nr:hypothetical protein [Microcella daejeonensis]WAB84452.1 hypothetical protein OVN20_02450 [Microcella daejeonensis]